MQQSKQVIPFFLIAAIVVVSVFFLRPSAEEPAPEIVIPIRTATIGDETPRDTMVISGTTRSAETAVLRFQVGGRVDQKLVSLGEAVEAGARLASLYNPEIEPLAERARENLARLVADRDQAKRDFSRLDALFKQQAVTRQEWENGKTRVTSASKAVAAAKSELARAERVATELMLIAPFPGTVTEILTDIGEVVTAGAPAIRISNPSIVELKIAVREDVLAQVSLGQEIPVRRSIDPSSQSFTGTVTEISPYRERGSLPEIVLTLNGQEVPPGSTVTAELEVNAEDKISIPIRSVLMTGMNTTAVYRIENDIAQLTPIRPLKITSNSVLIDQGIEAGDKIAVEGIAQLYDGAKVEVAQ